jgi:hypothetical protein
MALAVLPEGVTGNRAKNRALIKAVQRERELYPWRFSDAGERYARKRGANLGWQWQPAAPSAWAEMPDIPDFLRGYHARSDPGRPIALHTA